VAKKKKETVSLGEVPSGFKPKPEIVEVPKIESQVELFPAEIGTPIHKIPGKLRKNT